MIPESFNNSDIRLYKSTDFPTKWEFQMQLMSGVDAADTMVVKFGDTWFMFSNICSAGVGDHHAELHVFYSDHFPSNQWQEINGGNPVIFDPQKGRNAGLFWHKGILYRVNQVHGHAHYGKGFKVNEVIELSKDRYSENEVSCVYPDFKDGLVSTHHFSATPTVAVVDFARRHRKSIVLKD
ncbi:hypothetical protein N9D73_00795 [Planktomarina temperata]|nr:hypothetical protein [Planktomarina temperata]